MNVDLIKNSTVERIFSLKFIFHLFSFLFTITLLYFFSKNMFVIFASDPSSIIQSYVVLFITAFIQLLWINIFYFCLYHFQHPFFEKYKINNIPWPWIENPQKWKTQFPKTLKVYFFNQGVLLPLAFFSFTFFLQPKFRVEDFPSFSVFLVHFCFMIFCEDFCFYWSHRLMHLPFFYKRIHKKHHEYFNVIHIACTYAHPIEFIIGNVFPLLCGYIVLGNHAHLITLLSWSIFRLMETHECHSGYQFPWSPFNVFPFSIESSYHNFHHLKNVGNYATFFTMWDSIFKTNRDYYKYIKVGKSE